MKRRHLKIAGIIGIAVLAIIFVAQKCSKETRCYPSPTDYRYYDDTFYTSASNTTQRVQLKLSVKDWAQSQTNLHSIVSQYNGTPIRSFSYRPPHAAQTGALVFEIPPYYLDMVLMGIRNLGQVDYETRIGGTDVHSWRPLVPQTNIDNIKQQREQLLEAYSRQTNPEAARHIEAELSGLSQMINGLESNVSYVQIQKPEMVSVTVNYVENGFSWSKASQDGLNGLAKAVKAVVMFMVNMVNGLIAILGYLLPVSVWILVISLIVFFIVKLI